MAVEISYKKHKIEFREQSETWFNELIGEKKTLAAAKSALDTLNRKDRQIGVSALLLDSSVWDPSKAQICPVTITSLAEPHTYSYGRLKDNPAITECWINRGQRHALSSGREKVSLHHIFPPDARPKLEKYIAFRAEEARAKKAAEEHLERIPHYTVEALTTAAKAKTKG